MMISGFIVSSVGLSAMMSSGILGRIGDKIGSHRLIIIGLVYSFLIYLPMAFVKTPLQLGILRFMLGFGSGALMPSVNSYFQKSRHRKVFREFLVLIKCLQTLVKWQVLCWGVLLQAISVIGLCS